MSRNTAATPSALEHRRSNTRDLHFDGMRFYRDLEWPLHPPEWLTNMELHADVHARERRRKKKARRVARTKNRKNAKTAKCRTTEKNAKTVGV